MLWRGRQDVGIISEGDLLHRAEIGTAGRHRERRRSWWLDHFASDLAREYVKSHGRTVKDIMTRDVVTVTEDPDLGEVAELLEAKRIKRSCGQQPLQLAYPILEPADLGSRDHLIVGAYGLLAPL